MKVNKKGAIVLTALIAGSMLALAGCSGGGGGAKTTAAADTTPITVWTDIERKPALVPVAAQFTKDTGVPVNIVTKDFATVDQDFITQVPTGKGPDVIVSPHDKLGAYVSAGVVAPLELGSVASKMQPVAVQAVTYGGKVYGMPYSIENIALVRNTELAPNAAATYDDVIAAGKAAGTKYPLLLGLSAEQGDPYHMYPLQTSFGSQVFAQNADGSYDASKLVIGDAQGVDFAKWLGTQGAKGTGVFNANIDSDKAKQFFIGKQSPFYITGPWNIPDIKKAGIKYSIDPLPTAGTEKAQPFLGVNAFFLSSKSKNALAATNFIVNYLSEESVQMELYKIGGRPPALISAYDKAAAQDPDIKAFGDIGANGYPMPAIPEMGSVWSDWGNAEMTIIKGTADPAATWTTMAKNIQAKIGG
jgi:arabinogalactan oligomer/maltooligosaccharide transport system substrate-binding protein